MQNIGLPLSRSLLLGNTAPQFLVGCSLLMLSNHFFSHLDFLIVLSGGRGLATIAGSGNSRKDRFIDGIKLDMSGQSKNTKTNDDISPLWRPYYVPDIVLGIIVTCIVI